MAQRPTLKRAVDWIAYNDEPNEANVYTMADLISVVLIADLFGKTPLDVADLVLKRRGFR